jgi:hypothetical protein
MDDGQWNEKGRETGWEQGVSPARRRYPAANHAAEAVVVYDLQRQGAFELPADVSVREGRSEQ